MRLLATAAIAAVLSLTAACGSDEPDTTNDAAGATSATTTATTEAPAEPPTATEIGAALKADISEITKVETITEDNDPNDKIGRPGGYVDGAVMFDNRAEPVDEELGVDQGAFLEVWPDEASATDRSEFIQKALKDADGFLGSEYHYQHEGYLLRVKGELKPSQAKAYEATFNAQF